jgi:quercetin 2,3-dioxygenase
MMKIRSVKSMLYAHEYPMGKLRVRQPFPSRQIDQVDPFILLHHAEVEVPADRDLRDAGVGPHPHRGFSPVTFIFRGGVHHRDSRGNNSIIYEGGTQWMNAGMGIIHSERPPADIMERGGRQEIIQMWVNTPAALKMNQPEYFPLSPENTPSAILQDGRSRINVIAGKLLDIQGPIIPLLPVNAATISLKAGAELELESPIDHNAFLYLLDGEIQVEGYGPVTFHHAVVFEQDGDAIRISAKQDTRMLLMSGKPLHEPLATHGPFVMNNETQLLEAMRDYQMGKMGVLIED